MKESTFTGSAWGLFAWSLLGIITAYLSIILFFLYPIYFTQYCKWYYSKWVIDGKRLVFNYNKPYWGYIKWVLFIIITLGFGTYYALKRILQWQMSHVHFEDNGEKVSDFDGSAWGLFGWTLLAGFSVYLLFIPYIFLYAPLNRWINGHTIIDGDRLLFTYRGPAWPVLGWSLFSILTLGLGSFYAQKRILMWNLSHTHLELK
jgi:hypothetical protein